MHELAKVYAKNKFIITNKVTGPKDIKKVVYVIEVNINIASTIWYREYFEEIANILVGFVEVRKEAVYQKDYISRVLVIYSVLSQSETVDRKLMDIEFWDSNNIRHLLFKEIDTNNRLGTLYSNNLENTDAKWKVLENMSINDVVK